MSEEKKKKDFDEETLARVLEAAYVLQEHQHELEGLKSSLDLRRKSPTSEGAPTASPTPVASLTSVAPAAPVASPPPAPSPAPIVSSPASPPASIVSFPAASSSPASPSPIASPVAPASSPVPAPAPVAAKKHDSILAQAMGTQHEVQVRKLDLDAAMSLVAEQVIEICGAAGAAIGIVNRRTVCYRSIAGIRTLPAGSEVSVDEALCAPCLQSGEVWRCADTNSDNVRHREECRHRGIGSLIAAPLFHEGRSVGALELLFSDSRAFTEQDVQTCQLMAGIITEALSRDPGLRWKNALAADPALIVETAPAEAAAKLQSAYEQAESYKCYRCGHMLLAGEQFCGECGTPRSGDYEPAGIQSKVASLWHMQESKTPEPSTHVRLDKLPDEPGQVAARLQLKTSILNPQDRSKRTAVPHFGAHDAETTEDGTQSPAVASIDSPDANPAPEIETPAARTNKALEELISPPQPAPADWSSAASARDFLEQVADGNQNVLLRLWNTRRGDIYLAIAVILVACVIRWGMWSSRPAPAKPAPTPAASAPPPKTTEPDLPLSERMLIALGLADAPEPPVDKGNPSTQVWVDLHTALYYCPGADLYGKTANGKYTTQREAELDQFQPAYRKTCN